MYTADDSLVAADARLRGWIQQVKDLGIKLAHPDNGWVRDGILTVCYPYFDRQPQVGDVILLGNMYRARLVRVTEVFLPAMRLHNQDFSYRFEEVQSSDPDNIIVPQFFKE